MLCEEQSNISRVIVSKTEQQNCLKKEKTCLLKGKYYFKKLVDQGKLQGSA